MEVQSTYVSHSAVWVQGGVWASRINATRFGAVGVGIVLPGYLEISVIRVPEQGIVAEVASPGPISLDVTVPDIGLAILFCVYLRS